MPDPKPKLVKVDGLGVVLFPSAMPDQHISEIIKNHLSKNPSAHKELSITPSSENSLPPELQRVEQAVGAEYKLGKPYGDAIASVGDNEQRIIEINDKSKWNQGGQQTKAHELTHLALNSLPGPLKKSIPADDSDPKKRYDISDVDSLRSKGLKIWQLPQEKASTIVQTYTADPSQRKRLQPWIDDMANVPLSIERPVSPSATGIETTPRAPVPPVEAYLTPAQMKEKAAKLKADALQESFRKAGVAR